MSFSRLPSFGEQFPKGRWHGWKPTEPKMAESLKRRSVKALVGPVVEKVILHPTEDRWLVEEFIRLCPRFSYREARRTKADLLKRRCDWGKLQHILLCWSRLKIINDAFARNALYHSYVMDCYHSLFFLENQEEYAEFLDHISGQRMKAEPGQSMGKLRETKFSQYALTSKWDKYFMEGGIDFENLLSLSLFPLWDIEKPSKTDQLCWLPYNSEHEPEFRELIRKFWQKYCPDNLFVPSWEACHKVSSKKFNDAGEVRYDYETPHDWNSGFKLQSFLTGPLTRREVWLPGRVTKMSNSFWFSLIAQIIRKVPYYANNYDTAEELWQSIKDKLQGNAVLFDVTGFGIQFPRSLLAIAAEELLQLYMPSQYTQERLSELQKIMSVVWLEKPDGSFCKPDRGIGLGYYETLKTCCVLAILDHTDPISIFGDQGLIPFTLKKRANHPRTLLSKFGFIFAKPEKARILPDIESGVIWGGAFMTRDSFMERKSWSSLLAGALTGQYHWERKSALESLTFPDNANHIWKYLSFQYEIIFGYEFYKSESIKHFRDLGVNPRALPDVGNVTTLSVYRLETPKSEFVSNMARSPFPTKERIPRGVAKRFSRKRLNVFKKGEVVNTFLYEYSSPRIEMNNTKKPVLTELARVTPFWLSVRELVLNYVDTGTISYCLPEHDLRRALERFPLAVNPFEARSTGGYKILTHWHGDFGPTPEMASLTDLLIDCERDKVGSFIYRKDASSIPPSFLWKEENKDVEPIWRKHSRRTENPFIRMFPRELLHPFAEKEIINQDDTDLVDMIRSQIYRPASDLPVDEPTYQEDKWESGSNLPDRPEDFEDNLLEDYSDLLSGPTQEEYVMEEPWETEAQPLLDIVY
ncbi:putative RNA dependent RNA polymerase [Hortiboletus rubellus ormycovirus 1]